MLTSYTKKNAMLWNDCNSSMNENMFDSKLCQTVITIVLKNWENPNTCKNYKTTQDDI